MNPRYDFTGQVALVTGGSSGMGLATVEAFAEGGAAVVLADVNEEALRAATDELTLAGHQALGMLCDVSQEDQVAAMVESTVAKFGRLDMAFNNAGVQAPPADAAEPTERGQQHHPHRFGRATRLLFRLPTHLYDWHLGWLFDGRFLRLTHLGRRSGRGYQTVLEVVGSDRETEEITVMSGFGPSADWFRNLQAAPAVEVAIGRRRFRPQHRILEETRRLAFSRTTNDGIGSSPRSFG